MTAPLAHSISPASLTSFDWFLVVVAVISTLLAFRRGFVRVLFSLAGLVAGTLLASWSYPRFAQWLARWITERQAAEAVAFLVILFAVTIVFSLAAGLVRRTVRAVGLGFADRLLGAGVGLVRGVLLGVAVMMAMAAFDPHSDWTLGSRLAPCFLAAAHAVSFVVPKHFERRIADGTAHLIQKSSGVLKRNVPTQ